MRSRIHALATLCALMHLVPLASCSGKLGAPDSLGREQAERSADDEATSADGPRGNLQPTEDGSADTRDENADADGASADSDRTQDDAPAVPDDSPAEVEPGEMPTVSGQPDPGTKDIHRLNNREYDATVSDLLGLEISVAGNFLNESAHGFDNIASSLGMTRAQYTNYFEAAGEVAQLAVTEAPIHDELTACDEQTPPETECAAQAIESFGARALRRPLLAEEVGSYVDVHQRARGLGLEHEEAMREVVRAMLSSGEFLYRMEFDPDPGTAEVHPLDDYELASRLSYFLRGSMPDQELFSSAAAGQLADPEAVLAQTRRLLAEERAQVLVDAFAWQWLGMKSLESHAVLSDIYPEWDESLRTSLLEEARYYLNDFLLGSSDWDQFLTADLQFVDARLAEHYGQSPPRDDDFERRTGEGEQRLGFMGLGAFLTATSFAHRTSPTLRAKWVLEALLCAEAPPPPPTVDIGDLDTEDLANQAASIDNVRERLELHRSDPACAGCHAALDPLGLSLENYDAIGRYRTHYENGDEVDSRSELPNGVELNELRDLATFIQEDERFWECTVEKLMTYALGRSLTAADEPYMTEIHGRFQSSPSFASLVEAVVTSPVFLQRRGGGS